jgi:UDP-N-acetylglucosamine--N-acetylmuramyl-(pentapeptide) pyrophosphoryl-undecaprenol N-acetylglucosamine transferase
VVGKPAILIPSPNVAEDHQTKNAKAFSDVGAAILLPETEASQVGATVIELLRDEKTREHMSEKISALAKPNATEDIVNCINKWVS